MPGKPFQPNIKSVSNSEVEPNKAVLYTSSRSLGNVFTEAVFLVVCDPSMNEL